MNLYSLIQPLLFRMPPEKAHHFALNCLNRIPQWCLSKHQAKTSFEYAGIHFPNRVGCAAGLDKNGEYIEGLAKLGFGFIEVGTVTPKPQLGNPQPRLFRLPQNTALINRMGFNNKGVDYLVSQLKKTTFRGILGVNIGKNKQTPNARAIDDYRQCFEKVYPYACYIVINISSPNTPDLRALQQHQTMMGLLSGVKDMQSQQQQLHGRYVPVLVKISPDEDEGSYDSMTAAVIDCDIDGVIVSNTTVRRDHLKQEPHYLEQGGLSGQPLFETATSLIPRIRERLGPNRLIVGVGGIMSAQQGVAKITAGADLIQVYSGLIYHGHSIIKHLINAV